MGDFFQRTGDKWAMAVFGGWAVDGDGANTNGAGVCGVDVTLTEQSAAYAQAEDGGSYAQLAATAAEAGYAANYQLFPDTPVDNDAINFGADIPFAELALDMSATVQTYSGDALTWEYYDGTTWQTLTLAYDGTDSTAQDGKRSFQRDGAISFVPPSDWDTTTINSQLAYWIRARVSTQASMGATEGLTNSKEHELVTPTDGFKAPRTGTIDTIRLSDQATTLHTTADVKFMLVNFTTGGHSGELTFAQDQRCDEFTDVGLVVSKDDELGVICTQEDGTNEPTGVLLELGVL